MIVQNYLRLRRIFTLCYRLEERRGRVGTSRRLRDIRDRLAGLETILIEEGIRALSNEQS
jgi:hypothetical protein